MKSMKFVIVLLLLLILPACSTDTDKKIPVVENTKPVEQPVEKDIKLVVKQNKAEYLLQNSLKFDYISKEAATPKGKVMLNIITVSGLKSKSVQEKINNDIQKSMQDALDSCIANNDKVPEFIASDIWLNTNNLLSISITAGYPNYIGGLLYKLGDGERVNLKDLFTDGTDYISLLNKKVIEKILMTDSDESEILMRPFTTITSNQSFFLYNDSLTLIFKKGESGFARDYLINIPFSEIDDYMDLFEKQSNPDQSIYENNLNMLKRNNLYISEKMDDLKIPGVSGTLAYPVITGTKDPDVENKINKFIKTKINEFMNSKYTKEPNSTSKSGEKFANMSMTVSFNSYGYLCITENVVSSDPNFEYWDFPVVYSFDLKTGDFVNVNDLIDRYAVGNEVFKDLLTESLKKVLTTSYPLSDNPELAKHAEKMIDYPFIINSGMISFEDYLGNDASFMIRFRKGLLCDESLIYSVPLQAEMNISPESFFDYARNE